METRAAQVAERCPACGTKYEVTHRMIDAAGSGGLPIREIPISRRCSQGCSRDEILLAEIGLEHLGRFPDNPMHSLDYVQLPLRFARVLVKPVIWNEQYGQESGGVGQVEFVAFTRDGSIIGPLTFSVPMPESEHAEGTGQDLPPA